MILQAPGPRPTPVHSLPGPFRRRAPNSWARRGFAQQPARSQQEDPPMRGLLRKVLLAPPLRTPEPRNRPPLHGFDDPTLHVFFYKYQLLYHSASKLVFKLVLFSCWNFSHPIFFRDEYSVDRKALFFKQMMVPDDGPLWSFKL